MEEDKRYTMTSKIARTPKSPTPGIYLQVLEGIHKFYRYFISWNVCEYDEWAKPG